MTFPEYILKLEAKRKWDEEQARSISSWRYKLKFFRHTKPNAKRKVQYARPGFVWIGSWDNYESRLAYRWPIRHFFAYKICRHFWWPLLRVPATIKHWISPPMDHVERSFRETVIKVLGVQPQRETDVGELLAYIPGATLELEEAIIKAYDKCMVICSLSRRIKQIDREFKLRPGFPGKTFEAFPEIQWSRQLRAKREDAYKFVMDVINQLENLKGDQNAPVHSTEKQ